MDAQSEIYGVRRTQEVVDPGLDSNLGRCMDATVTRLADTDLFRMVAPLQAIDADAAGFEYPMACVCPVALAEEERTNADNWKKYSFMVMLGNVDDNWYRGVKRMGAMREAAEDAVRSKARIELESGDMHENTLLETDPYVSSGRQDGPWVFWSAFTVRYECTEPRRIE
jgi:hypothetical protein